MLAKNIFAILKGLRIKALSVKNEMSERGASRWPCIASFEKILLLLPLISPIGKEG